MPKVVPLLGRIDPHLYTETLDLPIGTGRLDLDFRDTGCQFLQVIAFETREPEFCPILPILELERQYTHPHEI